MAKRPAKGQVSKGNARPKASARKRVKVGVDSKTRPQVKARSTAAAKSKAVPPPPKRGAATAPPSTDIRRAYKSRLLAGYIGTHGADSIPSSKK